MSSKDAAAYRGYYCETCHQLRDGYGVMSTIIVSYEMTFANIVLSSIAKDGVDIYEPKAGKFCVFKHGIPDNSLLNKLAAYSVLVSNNSLIDNKLDGPSIKSNFGMIWLNHSIERAKKDYPLYDELIMKGYQELRIKEKAGCTDPIEMGNTSAKSMIDVLKVIMEDEWTEDLEELFLCMGTWVYILDAIDDLDEDFKENHYNPFLAGYDGEYTNSQEFIMENVYTISESLNTVVGKMHDAYRNVRPTMRSNTGIIDNILFQGVPFTIRKVMSGTSKLKPTLTDMISGKMNRTIGSSL